MDGLEPLEDDLSSFQTKYNAFLDAYLIPGERYLEKNKEKHMEFIDRIKEIYGKVKKLESFQQWDLEEVKEFLRSIKSDRYYTQTVERVIKEDKILARQLEKKTVNMDKLIIRALAQAYRPIRIKKVKESGGFSKHSGDYMLNALFDEIRKIISEEREMLKNRRNDLNEELRFLDLQVN